MTIYYCIVAYFALLGLAQGLMPSRARESIARRRALTVAAFLPLFFIMGFRSPEVGIDTAPYEGYYVRIGESDEYMHIVNSAPVYSLLNKFLYGISSDPQFLLVCCSLVICGGVAYFAYHLSKNVVMSAFFYVAFYFFCNAMNGMRQAMALSLCLVAFTIVLKQRKAVLPLVLVALSVGIHNTCAVLIPFVFARFIPIDKKRFRQFSIAVIGIVLVFSLLLSPIMQAFVDLFPGWYNQYADALIGDTYATSGRNLIQTAFFALLLWAYWAKCVRPLYEPEQCWLFLCVLCGLALATAFFQNWLLGARIPLYFIAPLIVITPNLICSIHRSQRLIFSMAIVAVSIAMLFILLAGNYAGVVPYEWVI